MRSGKLVIRSAVVCGLLVLTPITFTSEGGIQDNLACSSGKKIDCVREIDSVCTAADEPLLNYYTKSEI